MIRLLCLLGFFSLFSGCPSNGSQDDATDTPAASAPVADETEDSR